jgi:hypothetical protein
MKYSLAALLIAGAGISFAGAASAVDIHVNVGSPVVVEQGWHGDRYWDGHQYWERREWESRNRRPVVVEQGWHGDRYWDGHRYWNRKEWKEHNRRHDGRDDRNDRDDHYRGEHCPPGHAKKGEC